jgi:hypothetical protein
LLLCKLFNCHKVFQIFVICTNLKTWHTSQFCISLFQALYDDQHLFIINLIIALCRCILLWIVDTEFHTLFINCNRVSSMHQSEKSVFITVVHVWSNRTKISTEMNIVFSFLKSWSAFSVHLKDVFFCMRAIIDIIRLKVLNELSIKVCKVYETLYSLYWFRSLSVHDCLHLLRIHLYALFNFQNEL